MFCFIQIIKMEICEKVSEDEGDQESVIREM
jgi:hypothetical protein